MKTTNYNLRYIKAQQFFGYETPADVLVAMANFDNEIGNKTVDASLCWREDTEWGGIVTWEDYN